MELCEKCLIATKDFQIIRVCVESSPEETSHLERGVTMSSKVLLSAASNPELEASKESTKGINDGLNLFLVKPTGLKGRDLFSHMVGLLLKNTKATSPSKFLEVLVSTSNRVVLKDAAEAFMRKLKIIRDAGSLNATMKIAAINIDQMV